MSDFKQRPKTPSDNGPVLKRDENNILDKDDAARTTELLVNKLLTEERAYKKEISFNARGQKRDFVLMITLLQRNSVDGHIVLGEGDEKGFEVMDERDPYKYRVYDFVEAPILAKHIPMSRATTGKQMMGIFNVIVNYLHKVGIINNV